MIINTVRSFLIQMAEEVQTVYCSLLAYPLNTLFNSLFPSKLSLVGQVLNKYNPMTGAANAVATRETTAKHRLERLERDQGEKKAEGKIRLEDG